MIRLRLRTHSAKQAGEHEDLDALHRALALQERAAEVTRVAERLAVDADEAVAEARRAMRRISER